MSEIQIKRGASIDKCGAEILVALIDTAPLYTKYKVPVVVTSGSEAYKHSAERSGHYRGDAVDLRIKTVPKDSRATLVKAIKRKLGKDFVVLHEGKGKPWEHIHIHWSPTF